MSAKAEAQTQRNWLWPALFVGGVALALIISNLAGTRGPNGIAIIKSQDEYKDTLAKANGIFAITVQKTSSGQALTSDDTAKLREALKLYDSLNLYNPTRMGPAFASGRIHLWLGEYDAAAREFRQAIDDSTQATTDSQDAIKRLTADSQFYLATAYESMNDFQDALPTINDAIQYDPKRADYRYIRARALIQYKKIPEAIEDLKTAIKINPFDQQSASLLKFISAAGH